MYTLSLDIPAIQRRADRAEDNRTDDPLAILIAAEEELDFDKFNFDLGSCSGCGIKFKSNDWVWDGRCLSCM